MIFGDVAPWLWLNCGWNPRKAVVRPIQAERRSKKLNPNFYNDIGKSEKPTDRF
jgi:hypothetical protein